MAVFENPLLILLIILAIGLIVPELVRKLKIPFITILIVVGAILGPNLLGYVTFSEPINFLGFLGMAFLMFMAGLETDLSKIKELKYKIFVLAGLSGLVPFITGILITHAFGYPWMTSFLIGVIFVSSSVAVIIPALKSAHLFDKDIGRIILSATLIADILSLVLLSFVLQSVSPITRLPLPIYFAVLLVSVLVLFALLPRITKYFLNGRFSEKTEYERRLRFVIVLVISVLAFFSLLGVHPILAAFITGLALSQVVRRNEIYSKLHTLGYGFFVPIFFFIVGMEMDLTILAHFSITDVLLVSIVVGLIGSKFISGVVGGRLVHLSWKDSSLFGFCSIIQLTTTLAVTYAASSLGILDSALVTSVIILSVVTTVLGPVMLRFFSRVKAS
ncbi:hypothetical protein GF358_03350 [Candidatus Woesearchaeota archaeon]|nr:hypothetical protein [Candidatus Woesearchaeota archaeon]